MQRHTCGSSLSNGHVIDDSPPPSAALFSLIHLPRQPWIALIKYFLSVCVCVMLLKSSVRSPVRGHNVDFHDRWTCEPQFMLWLFQIHWLRGRSADTVVYMCVCDIQCVCVCVYVICTEHDGFTFMLYAYMVHRCRNMIIMPSTIIRKQKVWMI